MGLSGKHWDDYRYGPMKFELRHSLIVLIATTLTALGKAEEQVDNSLGANGALSIRVSRGVFLFANTGADAVTRAEIGKSCYVVNDYSVAKTNGTNTRSVAGKVIDVTSKGVWVEIG